MTPAPRLPPWPEVPLEHGGIRLRPFRDDVPMVVDLSTDPHVPLVGTLPAGVGEQGAREWLTRQRGRWAEGAGSSSAIADASTDRALGQLGLWLARLQEEGPRDADVRHPRQPGGPDVGMQRWVRPGP